MTATRRGHDTVLGTTTPSAAPKLRRFGRRRFGAALLGVPLCVVGVWVAARTVAVSQTAVEAMGAPSTRVLVHRLEVGAVASVPLTPDTDGLRFLIHAVTCDGGFDGAPRRATLDVAVRGVRGELRRSYEIDLPGTRERVREEGTTITTADPIALAIDTASAGGGTVVLSLSRVERSCAVAFRAFRRAPGATGILAGAAGREGADDLDDDGRAATGMRFSKVAPLASRGGELAAYPIGIAPRAPADAATWRLPTATFETSRGPITFHGRGAGTVRIDAPGTHLSVRRREEDASRDGGVVETSFEANDTVALPLASDGGIVVDVATSAPSDVRVFADGAEIEGPAVIQPWRAAHGRPLRITSGDDASVVRVTARGPSRGAWTPLVLGIVTETDKERKVERWSVLRPASPLDAYEASPSDGPTLRTAVSERASFAVVLPAHARVTFEAEDDPVDLLFGELAPDVDLGDALAGSDTFPALRAVPRRPSNAADVDPSPRIVLAPRLEATREHEPSPAPHVVHPRLRGRGGPMRVVAGTRYATASDHVFQVGERALTSLVFDVFVEAATTITAAVDAARPARKNGVITRVTKTRTFPVPAGASRIVVPVGDDLAPGEHVVVLRLPSGTLWFAERDEAPRWLGGENAR